MSSNPMPPWRRWPVKSSGMSACACLTGPHPPAHIEAMLLDRADAAWVGPVRAVLWGCKTVPCVSLCVRVFFGDDKLFRALVLSARIAPAPTDRLVLGDSVVV